MKKKKRTVNWEDPSLYINREMSWLQFNDRVLQQAQDASLPLAERLKFLAIVSSNLDEFFMVRVAGLQQQRSAGMRKRDFSGLTPAQQLSSISAEVHEMVASQSETIDEVLSGLQAQGFALLRRSAWSVQQQDRLLGYFNTDLLPLLTPLAVEQLNPCPMLAGLQLFVAVLVKKRGDAADRGNIIVIPVPGSIARFVQVPAVGQVCVTPLEDIIAHHAWALFPDHDILGETVFRITRDADVDIQDDDAHDLLSSIEEVVLARRQRAAVRLEIGEKAPPRLRKWLLANLSLSIEDLYEIRGLLDAKALMQLVDLPPINQHQDKPWPAQLPQDLRENKDLLETVRKRDVLLSHPYESFEPLIQLVQTAANDPDCLAIKQTLYRTSGDSPIVKALAQAAANGKEVTVLVELKARFDEANNANWARQLEDAGCHVIYGVAGFKTHGKALLIVRREDLRIRRYVHLSTGNYNDKTARLYSDIGLLSSDDDLCGDVASFFNLLTGLSEAMGWQALTIAPTDLRNRFIELIEREVQVSTPEHPGLIMAKTNSLQDKGICKALYKASQAGVEVLLNVRGICCLRPGIKGISETVEVRSIVDRYLEHARIYYFGNGGHAEVYLSSADWMRRNLDRRLEILFPIRTPRHKKRIIQMLRLYMTDNAQTWCLDSKGRYKRLERQGKRVRVQERLYRQAVAATRQRPEATRQFKPLKQPK